MNNIFKNSWILFIRNKEYLSSIVIAPVLMLLIFSFILSFQNKINIAIINQDGQEFGQMIEETIDSMEFVKSVSIKIEDVESSIINDKIDLAVIIEDNTTDTDFEGNKPVRIIKANNSSLADYMEQILNISIGNYLSNNSNQIDLLQNEVPQKGVPIKNSLGLTIFKMLGSASLLAGFIIMDKKNGIRNRIYMSKTGTAVYLAGRGIVFFIHLLFFTIIYFIFAKLFNFDFGMKNPIQILMVFFILSIFTTAYGLLIASFAKEDNTVWNFSVLILLPSSILSGALFPFEAMPKILQTVGSIFPQRWITIAIEILQKGGNLGDALLPIFGILMLAVVFFGIASIRLMKSQ